MVLSTVPPGQAPTLQNLRAVSLQPRTRACSPLWPLTGAGLPP